MSARQNFSALPRQLTSPSKEQSICRSASRGRTLCRHRSLSAPRPSLSPRDNICTSSVWDRSRNWRRKTLTLRLRRLSSRFISTQTHVVSILNWRCYFQLA